MSGWIRTLTVRLMSRHGALFVAVLAASSVGLVACLPVSKKELGDSHAESSRVTEVRVEGGPGGVTLHRDAAATQVTIARHFRYRGSQPALTGWDSVTGTVLNVNTLCGRDCEIE